MKYKLGAPYQISEAFYFDTMLDHYEEMLIKAKTKKLIHFINTRVEVLYYSKLQISN